MDYRNVTEFRRITRRKVQYWIFLALLIILLSVNLLDVHAQGLDSIGESNSSPFIRRWLALVFIEGERAPKAIEEDYLFLATGIPEAKFVTLEGAPKVGDLVSLTLPGYATQERSWKVLSLPENGDINEMLVVEGDIDNAVAYLLTFIESEEASRRELMIGSDDAVKVWLNGEVVHTVPFNRYLVPDQDRVAVNLKRGMNFLMIKVAESFGDWQLTARFDAESGLQFFDTSSRKLMPPGKRPIRLPNPQLETLTEGVWKTYRYVDGLASNWVNAILQEKVGVMWFGTIDGVSRFDGRNWETYNQKDRLAGNDVRAMLQDKEGAIWFGTDDGVSRFDGSNWETYTQKDGLASNDVRAVLQDKEGNIWFGTDGGVSRFDGSNWETYTQKDGLASNDVRAVLQDKEGNIWFGTDGGVSKFDGSNWETYTQKNGLVSNNVRVITQDKEGVIWFGAGGGVSRFDGRNWKTYTQKDGLVGYWVNAILQDKEGAMWFCVGGGVNKFDGISWKTYTQKDGLAGNRVNATLQDKEGMMWFGTFGNGVSRLDERSWKTYTQKDGLADNNVRVIIQDKEGAIWVGTSNGGGVSWFDGKSWKTYTNKDGLAGGDVYSILQDREGTMWLGTDSGISRFDGLSWKTYFWPYAYAILQDQEGVMWFGTDGGVRRFDGKSSLTYTQKNGLADNKVNAILQDKEGMIWFGTDGGINRFDGRNFQTYTQKDGLADNKVNAILQDQEGVIWFGTDGGINRFDGRNFQTYTQKDGLADNRVNAIMQDQEGVIWFGTNSGGVSRFDSRCFQTLDSRDGLVNDTVYSVCMDRKEQIWIGTKGGVVRFIPNKISLPVVYITQITADKPYTNPKGTIRLSSGVRRISFSYHGISFKTRPGGMKYFYQLAGKDTDSDSRDGEVYPDGDGTHWQGPTIKEIAEYFDLKPGEYTFKVKAVDRDLNYSEPAQLQIIIPLPFYMRSVFLVPAVSLSVILLGTLAILMTGFVKHRRQIRAYEQAAVKELQDARCVQMSLLPQSPPTVKGFDIAGFSNPAREVGGDFFDYLSFEDGKILLALADVSGKGLKAAMNATLANGMLREVAKIQMSCGRILAALNSDLYLLMEKQMFTALELAIIDQDVETLKWANAAQPYPIVKQQEEVYEFERAGGLPLSMFQDAEYPDWEITLKAGDIVIFYTDGIIEAENETGEMYSTERLKDISTRMNSTVSAAEIIQTILRDVTDFVGSTEQYDDMTIVVVKKL